MTEATKIQPARDGHQRHQRDDHEDDARPRRARDEEREPPEERQYEERGLEALVRTLAVLDLEHERDPLMPASPEFDFRRVSIR